MAAAEQANKVQLLSCMHLWVWTVKDMWRSYPERCTMESVNDMVSIYGHFSCRGAVELCGTNMIKGIRLQGRLHTHWGLYGLLM